jgi:RHS repeat-associated protein
MNHPSIFTALSHSLTRWLRYAIFFFAIAGLLLSIMPPAFTPSTLAQGPLPPKTPTPQSPIDPKRPQTPDVGANIDYEEPVVVGDPISAGSGGYQFSRTYFSLDGPIPFSFSLIYNLNLSYLVNPYLPYRFYWSPFSMGKYNQVRNGKTFTAFQLPNANWVSFKKAGSDWVLADPTEDIGSTIYTDNGSATQYVLKETANFFYLMSPITERIYLYEKVAGDVARIVRIMDRNGNSISYTYAAADVTRVTRIDDGLGRYLTLNYTSVGGQPMLWQVVHTGLVVFNYEAAAPDNGNLRALRSIEEAVGVGRTTIFSYTTTNCPGGGCIVAKTLPRGNLPYTQVYGTVNLNGASGTGVLSQTDAYGYTANLSYDAAANVITAQAPDTTSTRYEHYGTFSRPKVYTDTQGNRIDIGKNSNEQITSVTDRFGDTTSATYHAPTGKLASATNALGHSIVYTYTAQDQTFTNPISPTETMSFTFYNLTSLADPATVEQFAHDASGNVITHTDAAGQLWTYTYNARGQVLTATNPIGGLSLYTYNDADATLATSTDSDAGQGVTTYSYFVNSKKLYRITHPDGTFIEFRRDNYDRVTKVYDELDNVRYFYYDANGNLIKVTDSAGGANLSTTFAYDLMDRVTQIGNRLNVTTTQTYDALGRLISTTDPTGVTESYGYDSRSNDSRLWLNRITRTNQNWLSNYDVEGLIASSTTPLSHTTTYQRDKLGNITRVTDPLGRASISTYDALNRLTSVTDPLSRTTTYTYDARSLLAGITEPVVGTVTYQHNTAGNLTRITDLKGSQWDFGYSANGRLTSQTDPLSRTTTQSYDSRGRASITTLPNSTTLTRTYDAASNLIGLQSSTGLTIPFTYDSLNRLATTSGLQLGYDAEGRVNDTRDGSTAFGATYDGAGRLATLTYNYFSSSYNMVVTYTYSLTSGLLSRVNDSYGTQIDFTYDNDFRLIGVQRSNGVNATFSYDNADRLTRIQDGSVLDLQYTLDAASQVTQAQITAPIDPADYPVQVANLSYDAASQINTAGYTYDARGRQIAAPGMTYTWDAASRLTAINTTTLTYNGLNDVRTRATGGVTTTFYYHYALGLKPIVASYTNTPYQIVYYIYTPGGALLYAIDAMTHQPAFYHFDRNGSTLALTNNSGSVTDAYAYDPYGKLLAHTGSNLQPFTYVGQWGVRQESAALYQMRARYYDAATQRFLSRDPVWPSVGDVQLSNPYNYSYNNPLKYVDTNGMDPGATTVLDYGVAAAKTVYDFGKTTVLEYGVPAAETMYDFGKTAVIDYGGAMAETMYDFGKTAVLDYNATEIIEWTATNTAAKASVLATVGKVAGGPVGWGAVGVDIAARIGLAVWNNQLDKEAAQYAKPNEFQTEQDLMWLAGKSVMGEDQLEQFMQEIKQNFSLHAFDAGKYPTLNKEMWDYFLWGMKMASIVPPKRAAVSKYMSGEMYDRINEEKAMKKAEAALADRMNAYAFFAAMAATFAR